MIKRLIGLDFFPVNNHFLLIWARRWSCELLNQNSFECHHSVMFLALAKKDVFAK